MDNPKPTTPSSAREGSAPDLPEPAEQEQSHRLLLSVLLCLALSLALWAGRWGMAGLYTYPAKTLLEGWEKRDQAKSTRNGVDEKRWQMAITALGRAQFLEPNNADLHVLMGRLHHHRALLLSPWSAPAKEHWRQSIRAYRQALELRPTWGYLWILLAQARLQAGESATLTMADWMRALRFAPHSRDVQLTAIRVGFALWPQLDPQQQAMVDAMTKQVMPVDGEMILQQAAKYNLLQRIQPLMDDNPQWQRIYNRLAKKP